MSSPKAWRQMRNSLSSNFTVAMPIKDICSASLFRWKNSRHCWGGHAGVRMILEGPGCNNINCYLPFFHIPHRKSEYHVPDPEPGSYVLWLEIACIFTPNPQFIS